MELEDGPGLLMSSRGSQLSVVLSYQSWAHKGFSPGSETDLSPPTLVIRTDLSWRFTEKINKTKQSFRSLGEGSFPCSNYSPASRCPILPPLYHIPSPISLAPQVTSSQPQTPCPMQQKPESKGLQRDSRENISRIPFLLHEKALGESPPTPGC